jgi:hypothetical protein
VIVRTHRVNYARRQQYRRLTRASEAAIGAVVAALLGLWPPAWVRGSSPGASSSLLLRLAYARATGSRSLVGAGSGPSLRTLSSARWHR